MGIKPIYSICMVNLNMESTLVPAIASIANQVDERFEIIVVDGGSSDSSIERLKYLKKFYKNFDYIALPRDPARKLGADRNISVEKAKGEYCLLHLDCDDIYLSYIQDWVKVFHQLEACFGDDILVSGEHINMGKRETLLKHGPYRNIAYEDRDMWSRFAARGKWIPFKHIDFVDRIPKERKRQLTLAFKQVYTAIVEDLRQPNNTFLSYLQQDIANWKTRSSLKLILFRVFCIPFAWYRAKKTGKLEMSTELLLMTDQEREGLKLKYSQMKKDKKNFKQLLIEAGFPDYQIKLEGISKEIFLV